MKKWIILQLTLKGENLLEEDPAVIESVIKRNFNGGYFLPLFYDKNKNYNNKIFLMRGYVFLEHSEAYAKAYIKLVNTPYFSSFLPNNIKFHLISDYEVNKLKKKLKVLLNPKIKAGDLVRVLDGKFKNLKAYVTECHLKENSADLEIKLRCLSIIAPSVPLMFLEKADVNEADVSKIYSIRDKILDILANIPKGLTKTDMADYLSLSEEEIKLLPSYLSKLLKMKKIIYDSQNEAYIYKT